MAQRLFYLAHILSRLSQAAGDFFSYALIFLVMGQVTIVVMRYIFAIGSVAGQEALLYLNAVVFMGACGTGLVNKAHVSWDSFYKQATVRTRAIITCIGHGIAVLPFSLFVMVAAGDFIILSWQLKESSANSGGLPFVYLMKSFIWLFGASLMLGAMAQIMESAAQLSSKPDVTGHMKASES